MTAAAAWNGNIRIGVVESASSITIGADDAFTVRDKVMGATLHSGASPVTVTLESQQVITSRYRLQVMCGSLAAVNARKAAAEAAGHPTYTETIPACTRLLIGEFSPTAPFSVRNPYRNQLIAAGLAEDDSFWRVITTITGETMYAVSDASGKVAESPNPVVLTADATGGLVTINGVRYRGVAEVRQNASGMLAGVNELPIEEYLWGVVPRELPPSIWDELEAQKAQAVAARTYAVVGLGKRNSEGGYDLRATTSDQVYGGYQDERPLSTLGVNETQGVVATYGGALISALFSSTSGGHTADSEEAFPNAVLYLRGVPDAQRGQALVHVPTLEVFRAHPNPRSLRALKEGDFEADWSQYHRWTFQWTATEISDVVSAYTRTLATPVEDVGKVLAINVLERGPSGRALRIEYVTEAGTFEDTKDHIRTSLKFINASGGMSSLLSTLFFIEPVTDPRTKEVVGFRAFGGGWGHGVGLSQTGAQGMAEKGRGYEEILRHYYQGIDLAEDYNGI